MQDNEVANLVIFADLQAVVLIDVVRVERAIRKDRRQLSNPALYEMDAGGFQGFEKAAGQSQSDAVLVPEFLAPPGREVQKARLGTRRAVEIAKQSCRGLIVADE